MSDSEVSAVREQSPQALRTGENEGLLSAIVNQSTVGVSVVDLEGRFKFVNDCFSRFVGHPREELFRLGFADITR
jgi:PAS domain S-box-containing protein